MNVVMRRSDLSVAQALESGIGDHWIVVESGDQKWFDERFRAFSIDLSEAEREIYTSEAWRISASAWALEVWKFFCKLHTIASRSRSARQRDLKTHEKKLMDLIARGPGRPDEPGAERTDA